VDQLRKQELGRLKQSLSKEHYGQLKGAMWAKLKAPQDLSAEDRQGCGGCFAIHRI